MKLKFQSPGTSLVVQWLRCHAPNAGGPGLILSWGIRFHVSQLRVRMPQLRVQMQQLKSLYAAAKTKDPRCHS